MRPLRRLMARLEASDSPSTSAGGMGSRLQDHEKPVAAAAGRRAAGHPVFASAADREAAAAGQQGRGGGAVSVAADLGPIEPQDIRDALAVTKASARQYEKKYTQFSEDYGQLGS